MKKFFVWSLILSAAFLLSCKKDDPTPVTPVNSTITLRYDFTSDTAGVFSFTYAADTTEINQSDSVKTWTKSLTVTKVAGAAGDSASLSVLPPPVWVGTMTQANVTIKIFVNDVEKASRSGVIGGFDRPEPFTIKAAY